MPSRDRYIIPELRDAWPARFEARTSSSGDWSTGCR